MMMCHLLLLLTLSLQCLPNQNHVKLNFSEQRALIGCLMLMTDLADDWLVVDVDLGC